MNCPINYYKDNLIFPKDRSVWAAFRIIGYDYEFLDDESKIALLYRSARFFSGFTSKAQILIIPMEQCHKNHFNNLRSRIRKTDPLYDAAVSHADDTEKYLADTLSSSGDVNDYSFYLTIKLDEDHPDFMDKIRDLYQYIIKSPVNTVNVAFNMDLKDILASRIKKAVGDANKFYSSQHKKMGIAPVTGEELQMLYRRMSFRGLKEPVRLFYKNDNFDEWEPYADHIDLEDGEQIIRPHGHDIVRLFSGAIRSKNRVITVDHGNSVSYQTFLTITSIPEPLEFPGCEWLYMLQKYNTQAEVCISIQTIEYRKGLAKIDLKKRELSSQIKNVQEADARVPEDLLDGQDVADSLEAEIKAYREPVLNTQITICLAADNPEELEEKVIMIKEAYEDMQFGIERPVADQIKLYWQFIPGNYVAISDYVMKLTPLCLAGGIIGAVHELGDNEGPYIGTTGAERKPVYLNLALACLRNMSAAATFFGNLGVGKSFNANLLAFLAVLYGGYALIFDPKGERSHWLRDFLVLKGMINLVSLDADIGYKGKLDPYIIYRDNIDEANELALNIISELLQINRSSDDYTVLLEAADRLKADNKAGICKPSMTYLATLLENFAENDDLCQVASKLARNLKSQKAAGMSMLLFGDGSEEAISLEHRLNILQIQNLKLPSPETSREDYTSDETMSTVIMMVLSHFAKKFALVKRPVFKVILMDESWALGKTAEGKKLFDFLSRMGRSLYTGIIFNGHSVDDIPTEAIKNTISYKFCFKTSMDLEAKKMCEYMGLEPTEENKDVIKNLENGQCLFQDLDGHVGVLTFDAVFQDIIDVFSTTPITDEEKFNKHNDLSTQNDSNDENHSKLSGKELDQYVPAEETKIPGDDIDKLVFSLDELLEPV